MAEMAEMAVKKMAQEAAQEIRKTLTAAIAKRGSKGKSNDNEIDWDALNIDIEHSGRVIILPAEPEKMPWDAAIAALMRRKADDEQQFEICEVFDSFPTDAAVAFVKAMAHHYGWASPKTIPAKNFFEEDQLPQFLIVKTGPDIDDVLQCPIGAFTLPNVDGTVESHIAQLARGQPPKFFLKGMIKKKDRHVVIELVKTAKRILREESIYRGKPIRLFVDNDGNIQMGVPPEFMDVRDTTEADILFNDNVEDQISTNVFTPLRESDLCREYRIPMKRGILLEGAFGTGKSLLARVTARVAMESGWTFVLVDKVSGLKAALEFARQYTPAVVFAEDIDRVMEERDDLANDLVNVIDGVVSKGIEIMTILSTNFVEKIDPVMLRPGRLDAVISLRAPDAHTVQRLIRHYAIDLLEAGTDLSDAGHELQGQIPASIREAVERAKLGMIKRKAKTLSGHDLVIAAQTMKNHLALLNRDKAGPTDAEKLATSMRAVVGAEFEEQMEERFG
jgi:hypothetical protein